MKLYITPTSPYARVARIVVLEKGLAKRVEIVEAMTRTASSPFYAINPSGRVPFLVRDDGVGMEGSELICAYLDHLDGQPRFDPPAGEEGWEFRRLESAARGLLDGVSVWVREMRRPEFERSPGIVVHESDRARRLVAWWETMLGHPHMHGRLNMIHIVLACALDLDRRIDAFNWRARHPELAEWMVAVSERPSVAATLPD